MNNQIKQNGVTLDDLAAIVQQGFCEVHEKMDRRFNAVDWRFDKAEKSVFDLQCDVKELKDGQERQVKEMQELKEAVHGVFRIEMTEIMNRRAIIEEKLGIAG